MFCNKIKVEKVLNNFNLVMINDQPPSSYKMKQHPSSWHLRIPSSYSQNIFGESSTRR